MKDYAMKIGKKNIGGDSPCYIVAELGINHNGDLNITKQLIDVAVKAGCDAVKFQKRTMEVVYTPEELARPRPNPFGNTNGDLKRGLEFDFEDYKEIFSYCKRHNIDCFASTWDETSVDFVEQFAPPCYKIPSPMLTNDCLLKYCGQTERPLILSTGMSTLEQIRHAVEVLDYSNLTLLHCKSIYPCPLEQVNLKVIQTLKTVFPYPVGYSGHELGIWASLAAVALGSAMVERHVTLSRQMWGTDQAVSLEPDELYQMVQAIRAVETAMGTGEITILPNEMAALEKLRRFT
jgi:N-acetylneuraminate synthase